MKINIAPYIAIAPRIVPCHSEQHIVICSKYDFIKMEEKYTVSV